MMTSHNNNKKDKKGIFKKYMQTKLAFLFIVITLALIALSASLANIVQAEGDDYRQIVMSQQDYRSRTIPFRRGDIIDRNGTYLATSERVYNLILDPKVILANEGINKNATLDALVESFGYDRAELETILETKNESSYVPYEKQIPYETVEAYRQYVAAKNEEFSKAKDEQGNRIRYRISVSGVWFQEEYKRKYPNNNLASYAIGFSRTDGTEALWGGLEQQYNSVLIGTNGREYGYLNDEAQLERVIKPAENGQTIMSTIDVKVQGILEKHIQNYLDTVGAKNVAAIAMDPNNGEILGMASNRGFDPNNPWDLAPYFSEEQIAAMSEEDKVNNLNGIWRNFSISDAYEPGSTAKVFTIAAALDEGKINTNIVFQCDGVELVGPWKIKCSNKYGHGEVSLTQSLMVSCNDALMQIGRIVGKTKFTEYQKLFGFGERTGIDLPGETRGILHSVDTMGEADLLTNSFGQNYTVSMVQMASAYASLINGGSYYEPHMVKRIVDEKGSVIKTIEPNLIRETVSAATGDFIKDALFQTVEGGTGSLAHIDGYEIAGKTGTAEKTPRDKTRYLLSFCGFAPYDNPQILLYVIVDEPNIPHQDDSKQATGIFHDIMAELLPYLNVFPLAGSEPAPAEEAGSEAPAEGETPAAEEPTTAPEAPAGESEPSEPEEDNEPLPDILPTEEAPTE